MSRKIIQGQVDMQHNYKAKLQDNCYYMYGKHAVLAALANPKRSIENIFCTQEVFNNNQNLISKNKFQVVTNEFFTKILGQNQPHQGIMAKLYSIFSNDFDDIDFQSKNSTIAILDQITDPQNIGAIIRSAAAFQINNIIMPNNNTPNENATIAKAASGTLELVKVIKVTNLRNTMESLKKKGFWIIGLDGKAENNFNKGLITNKTAIVLGSEYTGLRRLTKETCDHLIKIPMSSTVESLNVSNAAAIIFSQLYNINNN